MTGTLDQPTIFATPPVLDSREAALAAARDIAVGLARTAADRDRTRSAPLDELATLSASGLLGIAVPVAHGGPELSRSTVIEVVRTLARGDASVAQLLLAHFVVQEGISGLGDREPAAQLYAGILRTGGHIGNAGASRRELSHITPWETATTYVGVIEVGRGPCMPVTGSLGPSVHRTVV